MRVLVAGALALGAVVLSAPSSTAAGETWYYRWSDGNRSDTRTVALGGTTESVPAVVVTVRPADAGRRVAIQVRDGGRWRTEDVAVTDARGRAVLGMNPFCSDGDWCSGTVAYRLLAGGRTAALRVTYRR